MSIENYFLKKLELIYRLIPMSTKTDSLISIVNLPIIKLKC